MNGYGGASLNSVCAAGISKGLLYHNYGSKDELYLACVKQCCNDAVRAFTDREPIADLQTYMALRLQFFEAYPLKARVIFEAMVQPPPHLRVQVGRERAAFDEYNFAFFKRIIDSLHLRKNVSTEDALSYFSLMQSLFNVYFGSDALADLSVSERAAEHEKKLPQLLDFMLHGITEREVL